MLQSSKLFFLWVALLLLSITTALAAQPAPTRVAKVVAEVVSERKEANSVLLRLRIERTLWGTLPAETVVDARWPVAPSPTGTSIGIRGLWTVRAEDGGLWTVLPAAGGAGGRIAYLPVASNRAIVDAMHRVLPADKSAQDLEFAELAAAVEETSRRTSQSVLLTIALLDSGGPSPGKVLLFARLQQSSNHNAALVGFLGLVRYGGAQTLDRIESMMPALSESQMLRFLGAGLRGRIDASPLNVAALGRVATNNNLLAGIREGAAYALRSIHSRETLPYLVSLLDSADPRLRQQAFSGLSMFVENLGMVTPESVPPMTWARPLGPAPYQTAETDKFRGLSQVPVAEHPQFVTFWRTWWARYGPEIMKGK
jgi:hypothetical protein